MIACPTQQRTLHGCAVQLRDRRLEEASVFPFFDNQGKTQALMVTTADSDQIALVDYRANLVTKRLFQAPRLDLLHAELLETQLTDAHRLRNLWHFDPWWELGDARYAGHRAVPILKGTNIPGYDTWWRRVWFDSALGGVRAVMAGTGDDIEYRRFKPSTLARAKKKRIESASVVEPTRTPRPWRLQPFWE